MKSPVQHGGYMFKSYSAKETQVFGRKLADQLKPGDVVALRGELGAGKTCLAQGIAAGLGVHNLVTSPTFTIVSEYMGRRRGRTRLPVYHIDLYRLDSEKQIQQIGLDEYIGGNGVTIIEWAEKIRGLPPHTLYVNINVLDENYRIFSCSRLPSKRPAR